MAEIRIYHGKDGKKEPPKQMLREMVEKVSKENKDVGWVVEEISHHSSIQYFRKDFNDDTKGESVMSICYADSKKNVPVSDVDDKTIRNIEDRIQERLGNGYFSIVSIDESFHTTPDGKPKTDPRGLDINIHE